MRSQGLLLALCLLGGACSESQTVVRQPARAPAAISVAIDAGRPLAVLADASGDAAQEAMPVALDAAVASTEAPEKEIILEQSKRWPFFVWDSAKAYTYNLSKPGGGFKLRVYSQSQGWTNNPSEGPVLSKAQSKRALSLVRKTRGEMIVSKCPFPRHGIVFFQGEVPVGSVSVCFECGDIMVWPAYSKDPNWADKKYATFQKDLRAYKGVFPAWKKLFESGLGLSSDWEQLPSKTP